MNPIEMQIKVQFCNRHGELKSIHRFRGRYNYDGLTSVLGHLLGTQPNSMQIEYVDDENDRVRIGGEVEWNECMRLFARGSRMAPGTEQLLRLFVCNRRDRSTRLGSSDEHGAVLGVCVEETSAEASVEPLSIPHFPEAPCPAGTTSQVVPPLSMARLDLSGAEPSVASLLSELLSTDELRGLAVNGECHLAVDRERLKSHVVTRGNALIDVNPAAAEALFKSALPVLPRDSCITYNLGCALSRQGKVDEALGWLGAAVEFGFSNRAHMATDPDLKNVQGNPRFAELLAAINAERLPRTHTTPRGPAAGTPASHNSVSEPVTALPTASTPVVSTPTASPPVTDSSEPVAALLAIFPEMSAMAACGLLKRFGGNVQRAVNSQLQ